MKRKLLFAAFALLLGVSNVWADTAPTASTPTIGKSYYIYNPTTGKFLAPSGEDVYVLDAGTEWLLEDAGSSKVKMRLKNRTDSYFWGKYWAIFNGNYKNYTGEELFSLSDQTNKIYKIRTGIWGDTESYVYINTANSNRIACNSHEQNPAVDANYLKWQFVTKSDYITYKYGTESAYIKHEIQESEYVDLTTRIVNPSFEDALTTGWTNTGDMARQGNDSFEKTGSYYAEYWEPDGTKGVSQTLSGLPAGYYSLSADCKARSVTSAKIFANTNNTPITIGDTKDTYSVNFYCDGSTNFNIGFEGIGTGYGTSWLCVDNFTLSYKPYISVIAEDYPSDGSLAAETWYVYTIPMTGDYYFSATSGVVYTTNGAQVYDAVTTSDAASKVSFNTGDKVYVKSTSAQTVKLEGKFYLSTTVDGVTKWLNKNESNITYVKDNGLEFIVTKDAEDYYSFQCVDNNLYVADQGSYWVTKISNDTNNKWQLELTDGKYKVKLKQNTDCLLEVHDTSTGLVELSRSTDNGYYWSFVTPDDYAKYVALAGINAKITAVGTLPYADPEKKPSTYNATSASDAETHAASLTTALRAYVESNALAEGVAGRLDFTSSILEPSCVATEASGDKDTYNNGTWTCVEVRANGGEGYTNAAGTTKGFYFDSNGVFYGNTTGSRYASLTQTISNLPAGSYLLTVTARKSANLSTLNLVANGESAAITNPNGVFGNSWDDTSVEFSVGSDGQATISINADKEYDGNTGRWFSADNFRLVNLGDATVSATVGANGYTTFASPYALDLTDENRPKGLKAYKATLSGDELSFTAIDQTVPAGTGLLLLGETKGGTYNIPIVAEGDDIENDLVGVTTPTSKQSSEGGVYYFVMMKAADAESPLEFFPLSTSSEVTIPAGKAYVEYDTTSSGAKSLRVVIDGHATEVTAPAVAETEEPEILYNMAGIPVGKDFKGIVINQKGEKRFNK